MRDDTMEEILKELLKEVIDLHASYDRLVKNILQVLGDDEE
tara:strand:- start:243 stop:365 length:123 start_codon:yes stop_codon:yes gene_type:complete